MNIIVTGEIGIGKSTICRKVLELSKDSGHSCGGILTLKMPEDSLTVMNIHSGETALLAIPGDKFGGPLAPRFTFDPQGIDFGLRAVEEGKHADILLVDELGILETMGQGFIEAFESINDSTTKNSIIVIRKDLLDFLIPGLREEPLVFEATEETRDRLPDGIYSSIFK